MTDRTPTGDTSSPRLAGKTALVTGSTRGIGRTVAERLGREGAKNIVSGRDQADVDRVIAELAAMNIPASGLTADLSRPNEAHRLGERAIAMAGRLDILVNNAGMSLRGPFWDVSDADWEYQVNTNYRAPFILAQHAARHMRQHGLLGRIINTSTVGAHRCHADAAVYDSAKAAVEGMTRNMAHELARDGITVNCVIPGPIGDRPGSEHERPFWGQVSQNVPVGRVGTAADVAAAVLFFALPESLFTTGQSLLIDGGYAAPLPKE
ncbi:MAG: SDR family oxidoreductase [Chloroflexota bacterium]|nr:SDR family oxidoreductase [Chloroflexota bacterium]